MSLLKEKMLGRLRDAYGLVKYLVISNTKYRKDSERQRDKFYLNICSFLANRLSE